MKAGSRLGSAVVVCVALVCLVSGFAAEEAPPPKPSEVVPAKIVFPADRSVVVSGELDVICKSVDGELAVDGEVAAWEPFEPPLQVAHLSLYPGRQTIRIGKRQLEIFVAKTSDKPDGPKGWEVYRFHSMEGEGAKRCAACHETRQQGGRTAVGELKSYKACFECHRAVEFELVHSHPLEPIEHCQMCHYPHGSTRKALLKAPVKKLCADCHDS